MCLCDKFFSIATPLSLQVYGELIVLLILSGSGKSYLAKMVRDLEVENGGNAPRIHSMDDYFMTEVEKVCCWLYLCLMICIESLLVIINFLFMPFGF